MSPSQTQPFTHLILTSHVLVAVCLLLSLPTQCTSLRSNDAAFTSNYILNQPSIRKTTVLLYQIIDEPLNKQRISPSAKKDSKDEDTTDQVVLGDTNDSKNIQLDNNEAVEDNKDWISATRNIGSLILHLKDETKDSNVDVFGRPLNLPQIDQFGLPTDYDNSDDNGAGWQSSLASYLLKLKRDEEDNRERIFEENKGRKRSIMEDGESSKLSMNIQLDQKMKELDESVKQLSITDNLMNDIQVLPNSQNSNSNRNVEPKTLQGDVIGQDILRLSYPEHYKNRIGRDMRHLAVSIAASIDQPWQWKLFFDEGGGVLPLLECIRDGARSVEKGRADGDIEGTANSQQLLLEQQQDEVSFAAACTACRALRDLSALSKDFAAVVTDDILRVNEQWSTCVVEGEGYDCYSGGLISDLLILLRHANEAESFYNSRGNDRKGLRGSRRSSRTDRKGRQEARRRCGLYVVQLLLAMVVASDKAAETLRATSGLIEAVEECSSYAPSERFKRKWVRKPLNFIGRKLGLRKTPLRKDDWLKPGLKGQVQQNANKLLAGIGHNIWTPKLPGQKGLRILCLDGGGTRGIAAVNSIGHMVKAMKGVEVCDAFDMIVGTSTGAIVGFLVGLRRESAADARIRYDVLIKRIFVKSLLKPIMLATTTASYDEANLMEVLEEILKDDGMLDSRANPAVPLITAVSSKMSSTPSQLALLRNYNYGGGEMPDSFCIDPQKARKRLGLANDDIMEPDQSNDLPKKSTIKCAPRTGKGSRYPGSFRVTQKIALRATTAAPTFFKPLLSFDELYVDGGILASNPTSVAVHEARSVFPDIPIELVVSVGTGRFEEIKVPPRVGWDGIVAQILDSATDAEQVHHAMEDVFGEGSNAKGGPQMSSTKYFRFNPLIGEPDSFPIDEIDPERLQELCDIVDRYMDEDEQKTKLKQLGDIIHPK
mmetsp:Transcript_4552/g.9444  ORF Transcript_4552/g.9444 Transcript_4552/m.9444 type:complete len:938 (+) Transcript_4552:164-2977(+)